jgi:hypothetical protein
MWYHFAFMAISIAMFGMTLGAVIVYIFPACFSPERALKRMATSAILFSMTIVASVALQLQIPFSLDFSAPGNWLGIVAIYVVVSVPFLFGGICVCLALTQFPGKIGPFYAADLAGSALGCILVIGLLSLTDGLTAVVFVAFVAAIGALSCSLEAGSKPLVWSSVVVAAALGSLCAVNGLLANTGNPLLRIKYVKGDQQQVEARPLYEKWNSFSRVTVDGNPDAYVRPIDFLTSPVCPSDLLIRMLYLRIDADAFTPLIGYDGDLGKLRHFKYSVTSIANQLRPNADVAVIGPGGGQDILSALVFGQKSIRAIEINGNILKAVTGQFADFTGHLERDPRVTFVNDEARSYLTRNASTYDIIQLVGIETWAATAAGAYVCSENGLYTVEAWKAFLQRLTPRGILTLSRFYYGRCPGEAYRMVSLASAALKATGIAEPRGHIMMLRRTGGLEFDSMPDSFQGFATLLVSREPFKEEDIKQFERICLRFKFDSVVTPGMATDSVFAALASGGEPDAALPVDVSAPTDDRPFFMNLLRFRDAFNQTAWNQGVMTFNMKSVTILAVLLLTVSILTLSTIVLPLMFTVGKENRRRVLPFIVYFSCIGLGFMFVEVSQVQRLIVLLGHPTYGLSVVLFCLLLSSSLGSFVVQRWLARGAGTTPLFLLLAALVVYGMVLPEVTRVFSGAETPLRILVAGSALFSIGIFMGMALPLGMERASRDSASLMPWLFGINGAVSVCASVLAMVFAMNMGISFTFWMGVGSYLAAPLCLLWAGKGGRDKSGCGIVPRRLTAP